MDLYRARQTLKVNISAMAHFSLWYKASTYKLLNKLFGEFNFWWQANAKSKSIQQIQYFVSIYRVYLNKRTHSNPRQSIWSFYIGMVIKVIFLPWISHCLTVSAWAKTSKVTLPWHSANFTMWSTMLCYSVNCDIGSMIRVTLENGHSDLD